jgi:phosphatidylserine/phosphatidylglycerophosphate/cardiolipin synthase-like enzyme
MARRTNRGFGLTSVAERRMADLFYADLTGTSAAVAPRRGVAWPARRPVRFTEAWGEGAGESGGSSTGGSSSGSSTGAACSVWVPAVTSTSYTDWIAAPTTGLLTLLINGRSSNGPGADIDRTEPLDEMQRSVAALGSGDFCYLSAWFFEPSTALRAGSYRGESTWGGMFGKKAGEGVEIRILINDFDPFTGLDSWLQTKSLIPLEALVRGLPAAARRRMKYMVTRHPANYAGARAAVIRRLSRAGSGPIFIGSHHQKFMVTRKSGQTTAFCGGLDIESRKVPSAWNYSGMIGWHDLTLKMEGPITRDVERQFVERWNRERSGARNALLPDWGSWGTLSMPSALPTAGGAAAKSVQPVQLTRTVSSDARLAAYSNNRNDIRVAYRNIVNCAGSFLYLENQYFRDLTLADEIAARGRAQRDLRAIFVVLANAAADDGTNPLTSQGDSLQHEFFKRVTTALGNRAGVYTMFNRSVHSKLILADDRTMSVGSANANVRSFDLDSELNVTVDNATWTRAARLRLWSHNLGVSEATIGGWAVATYVARWDAVARANGALTGTPASAKRMAGEGVVIFDWRANPGSSNPLVPDYLVRLDVAPAPNRIYGTPREPAPDTRIA